MDLRTRVSLGTFFAASAAAATLMAWHVRRDCAVPPPPLPSEPPPVEVVPPPHALAPAPAPPPAPAPEVVDEPEPAGNVAIASAGDVNTALFPKGYVRELAADKTADLIAFVNAWIGENGLAPAIEYRKGVVFAESREDRADDGPLPRSADPESQRACGTAAVWLRHALEKRLANTTLVCARNVCWYGGMEWEPSGYVVLREYTTTYGEKTWALDAWVQIYDAALPEQAVRHNEADVTRMLKRVASTSCPSEPAGSY